MAEAPVTKIYDIRTLGYDQVITQLKNIESSFIKIREVKQALNRERFTADDADKLGQINEQLIQEKIKTQELRLEKQKLTNESKALQNIRQAEINQIKAINQGLQAESGGYADTINKIKILKESLKLLTPQSTQLISYQVSPNQPKIQLGYDQAVKEVQRLMLVEKQWRDQFKTGSVQIIEYTKGIVDAFHKIGLGDLIQGQLQKVIQELALLDAEALKLKADLSLTGRGTEAFNKLEQQLLANRNAAIALDKQIITLKGDMQGMGDIGSKITAGLAAGFDRMKGQLSSLLLTYVGWFAAFQQVTNLVKENIKLSDSFADLQIRIHSTKGDVDSLFESLKRIDTRTSLKDLVDIANIVAKKGVAKDQIAGLTEEFDKLNVVLGKEIGDPGTATASIIKLITIFNDDKHVTADRVREIGTELFKLTTTGVATGEFLVNFAERVGAVRGITGLTLPNILGMGAALQQLGQRTEVAGTAAVQLTTKLFTNVEKFAKAAKLSVEDFRALLKDDPFKALIAVAEGLKSLGGDDIQQNFEEVVQAFGEVGIVGVRIKAVLGDIATNGKFIAERMKTAAVTSQDYANETAALEAKQHNLAATIERVRKEFELIGTNRVVQLTFGAIAAIVLLIVQNLNILIPLIGIYAAAWTIANAEMIKMRIATLAANIQFTLQYALLQITTTFTKAYTAALELFTGATTAATAATRLLGIALKLIGIGAIIALVAALLGAFNKVKAGIDGTSDALRKLAEQRRINQEIDEKANDLIGDQVSKLEALVKVVTSTKTSYDTNRIALDELIQSNNKFSEALEGNTINLTKLKKIMGEVREEIILNARAQASATLSQDAYKNYLNVIQTRQILERSNVEHAGTFYASTGDKKYSSDVLDIIRSLKAESTTTNIDFTKSVVIRNQKDMKSALKEIKQKEEEAFQNYQNYLKVSAGIQAQVAQKTDEHNKSIAVHLADVDADKIKNGLVIKLSQEELEDIIKIINSQIKKLKEGDPKLIELEKQREIFQKRLEAITKPFKKQPGYHGAKLSGEDKDELNEIEAKRRSEIAEAEAAFSKLKLDHKETFDEEEDYVKKIRDINVKYLDQKIAYLKNQGALNAKEKEQLATFIKEKADIQLKALQDIQGILDKEFSYRKNILKKVLDEQIEELNLKDKVVQNNPQISQENRAQHRLDTDKEILALQEQYNKDVDLLEKQLNQRTQENAKENGKAVLKIKQDIADDEKKILEAQIRDIRTAGDNQKTEYQIIYQKLRNAILDNDKLTIDAKKKQLERLTKLENYTIAANELAQTTLSFKKIKEQYDKHLVDEKTFLDAQKAMEDAYEKFKEAKQKLKGSHLDIPSSSNSQQYLTNQLSSKFGFAEGSDEQKLLGEAIAQSFDLAKEAMNSYFEAEENRIKQNLAIYEQRLDIEKQQVIARAQSTDEIASIEKQYNAKKLKAEREAAEKLKAIKRGEAKIALATELANIAVAAASAGASAGPAAPAVIPILYAILAALALGRYAININNINSQQFKYGGTPDLNTVKGGVVRGRKHEQGGNPFIFKGRQFEDEVDELNVIRTRDVNKNIVHTISGTHTQIASKLNVLGGGVEFAPGATASPAVKTGVKTFASGGILGSNYTAPSYTPSSAFKFEPVDMSEFTNRMIAMTDAVNKRIDRLEVYQVTGTVTDAQRKEAKQKSIGVLG